MAPPASQVTGGQNGGSDVGECAKTGGQMFFPVLICKVPGRLSGDNSA